MDFDRLFREAQRETPTEPRELYASLPQKAEGYGYLRDVQGQVLTAWYARRDERDLIIKVNTGAGKTIDGLVILQSYLNEGHGPALYVAPTPYLVGQVRVEAERIGVSTVDDPDLPKYLTGEAIAVVNIWKLFNGKSVFRDSRPSKAPAPIGSVVIDDAHAALGTARRSLSIAIPYGDVAFAELLALFKEDLNTQAPNELLDVEERSFGALARVPFWAWRTKLDAARRILHKARETDPLKFSWPAVRDVLGFSRVVFTGEQLTITPLCSPVSQITNFHTAKHRVYLTATLADDSVLVTDFGAEPASVSTPITPATAGDIGERMILAPMELNPAVSVQAVRNSIKNLAEQHNVVVIVPSKRIATIWQTYTTPDKIIYADEMSDVVKRLRTNHVGLVVLVNKYDGVDLPGDGCRVLVLDGLPEAFSGDERVQTQLTSRLSGIDEQQVQRIEQGMGRGVRSNEDHCVVFLLGGRLTQLVADPNTFALFGPATQAQLRQSRQIAGDLEDQPLAAIIAVAKQALNRDPGWVKYARSGLAGIPAAAGHVSPTAVHRREAFDLATAGNINGAVKQLSLAVEATEDPREQGWLLEQQATYLDYLDPERAQSVLAAARSKNASALRPLSGVQYEKISVSAAQAASASTYLTGHYGQDAVKLRVGFEAVLDALRFDPDQAAAEQFERAFCELGLHLGFAAQRPEHDIGQGPDVLWALGDLKYWVVEAKSGATSTFIGKRDSNQLSGSMLWFNSHYDSTVRATPVIVHPADTLGRDASATAGTCVMTTPKLKALRTAVREFATALTQAARWDDPTAVDGLLTGHGLRAADLPRYLRTIKVNR